MEESPSVSPNSLYSALIQAQEELPPTIIRDGTGHRNKGYTTLENILTVIRPILSHHSILLSQTGMYVDGQFFCETALIHPSGEKIKSIWPVNPDPNGKDHSSQELGKSWSYARRYSLLALLGIGSGDTDIDTQDHQKQQQTQQHEQPQRQQQNQEPDLTVPNHNEVIEYNSFINENKKIKGITEVDNILLQYNLGGAPETWVKHNMQIASQLIQQLPQQ